MHISTKHKRILYLAKNRGCKETEIILGNFINSLSPVIIDQYYAELEQLLLQNDLDIYQLFSNCSIR